MGKGAFKLYLIIVGMWVENVCGYTVQDAPLLENRPIWLKACQRSDSKINECINDMFLHLFPYLAAGIPEIKVEHFEPLALENVAISKGSGPIVISGKLYDLHVEGPSNSTPKNSEFIRNGKQGHWNLDMDIPLLDIKSKYNLKGQILVLPLVGHGNCQLKLSEIRTKISTNITFPERNQREIMQVDAMKVKFRIGGLWAQFDHLFNGNEILGRTVNAFINQNGLEIIAELEESIANSLAQIFKKLMNNVFVKMPTDLWYLDEEQFAEYQRELKTAGTR
ncbi:protein takeout [Dendroctonus ponderosae]|uniref:protein takeout n=1 Tax=Dendroctonus ponderosae TaxID=77166 RepID=UPI002035ED8B|nr:protein takeout [Dendroctonus ponderosae]KAH1023698.1 hypothetical protein HUJ05_003305 [Dendroctonus ponderosae]